MTEKWELQDHAPPKERLPFTAWEIEIMRKGLEEQKSSFGDRDVQRQIQDLINRLDNADSDLRRGHGYTQREMSDHEFAAFLREHDAIDNVEKHGKANFWRATSDAPPVAVAFYTPPAERDIWLRNDLA